MSILCSILNSGGGGDGAGGDLALTAVTTAAGTTVGLSTDELVVFTGATTQTYTMPTCSSGKQLHFKNKSTGAVTLQRGGTDTIEEGAATTVVLAAGDATTLRGHVSDWMVMV